MTGAELKALRESAGLTQTELAKQVCVSGQVTIARYELESRKIPPSMALLFQLALSKQAKGRFRIVYNKLANKYESWIEIYDPADLLYPIIWKYSLNLHDTKKEAQAWLKAIFRNNISTLK